jgi:hypothetical protein
VRQRHAGHGCAGIQSLLDDSALSLTGQRRLCDSLLTTARSEVSIYSPSGRSRKSPHRVIFRTNPHFV